MAASALADLSAVLKPVFGQLQNYLPEVAICQELFEFKSETNGEEYRVPVAVRAPWGVTWTGTGVTTLVTSQASRTELMKITASPLVLRDQIPNSFLDRAKSEGKASLVKGSEMVLKNLAAHARRIQEIAILHGQEGIGTLSAYSSDVCTISEATFAPGIISFLENAVVDIYQSDLSTVRTEANQVTAVDLSARTFTLTTGHGTTPASGDVVFVDSALASGGTFSEPVGLGKQLKTVSGTVLNVSKTTYSMYRASVVSSAGQASAGLLVDAAVRAANRGFQGELVAIVAPKFWGVLNSSMMSAQTFDSSYSMSKGKLGVKDSIDIAAAHGIVIKVVAHPFQKEGQAYLLPKGNTYRVGSLDMTFNKAGSDEAYMEALENKSGVEFQVRMDQAPVCDMVCHAVHVSGITYA